MIKIECWVVRTPHTPWKHLGYQAAMVMELGQLFVEFTDTDWHTEGEPVTLDIEGRKVTAVIEKVMLISMDETGPRLHLARVDWHALR